MILSAMRFAHHVGVLTRALAPAIALVGAGILYKYPGWLILINADGQISWLPIVTLLALLLSHLELSERLEK